MNIIPILQIMDVIYPIKSTYISIGQIVQSKQFSVLPKFSARHCVWA